MKAANFRLVFNRKKKKLKSDEKSLVQVEVYFDGVRKYYSTGVYLKSTEWNKANNRVMKREDSEDLNNYLYDLISKYEAFQAKRFKRGLMFSHESFTEFHESGPTKQSFLDFFEKEIDLRDDITRDTKDNHKSVLARVKKFGKIKEFDELTYENIERFDYHLRTVEYKKGLKYTEETIATSHAGLKNYIGRAKKKGLTDYNPYSEFEIKEPNRTNRKFLTLEELQALEVKVISIPRISRVRDMFVFSCYTGLAYGDAYKLSTDHIVEEDGNFWIRKKREKVGNRLSIPLLPKAIEIIEKYKNEVLPGKILPYMSNQKMNSYLKEIGDLCDIKIELTTHVARHTFATTVTLSNGVPLESVSKLLGHTNLKTTQIYAKIVDSKILSDMESLKKKIQ
jgi:integrase/recombinase XerD